MPDRENSGVTGNQFSPLLIRHVGADITTPPPWASVSSFLTQGKRFRNRSPLTESSKDMQAFITFPLGLRVLTAQGNPPWERHLLCIIAQVVKNLPAMQETPVWFPGQEDLLEKEKATHPSILT